MVSANRRPAFAIPQVMKARVRAFAASETENLRIIEAAKGQFSRANPGVALSSESQLTQYLPNGEMPTSPWGMEYVNVTDLTKTVASPANGMAAKEPPVEPLAANGFNDLGTSGLVYLERLEPTAYQGIAAPSSSGATGTTYSLSLSVNPPGAGTVTGGGLYPAGTTVTYSTTPLGGCTFLSSAVVAYGFHPLRSTFNTEFDAVGVKVKCRMKLSDHTSPVMSLLCTKLEWSRLCAELAKLPPP